MGRITGAMMYLVQELVKAGLSEKESAIYVAALQLGRVNANTIAKRSGVARATTYSVLRDLEQKGLVTVSARGNERMYQAEHPQQIEHLLNLQKADIETSIQGLKYIKPRLLALHNPDRKKIRIRYFEGLDGMKRLRKELALYNGEMIQMVGYDAFMLLQDPEETKAYRTQQKEESSRSRSILITDKHIEIPGIEIICVPEGVIPVEGEMTVMDDRLVLFSYANDIMAVEITSQAMAETARATLEFAWRFLQKENPHPARS